MCGIVGYLGTKRAMPILLDGLHQLEYRGYDSAGIAVFSDHGVELVKRKGRVDELDKAVGQKEINGTIGIGHTRWATHGMPSENNAHPHQSYDGRLFLVHNGIIENYATIKELLLKKGVKFKSETDTEVLVNLIAEVVKEKNLSVFDATKDALQTIRGAFAIAIIDNQDPDSLIVARRSSPLAVGIADNGFVIGSDATPLVAHTQKVIYLKDDEIAELKRNGEYNIVSLGGKTVAPVIETLGIDINKLQKNGYPHFMLKEIHEQPQAIRETMRGRLSLDNQTIMLGGIIDYEQRILRAPKITIVACGTSWHAGMVGKYLIEELAGIPVEVDYASEYRYRKSPISNQDVVLAISQSGETADTLAAIELAKKNGALTLGLVNVVGSSIARATDAGVYTHAGPEISVASTKAFTTQVTVLTLMALRFAQQLGTVPQAKLQELYKQFSQIPDQIEDSLDLDKTIETLASRISKKPVVIFLGRNNCYPVALEAALKLKEITYIPAEGYPAGEMKHGPIALISKGTPVFAIASSEKELAEKLESNIQEIRARGGETIYIGSHFNKKSDEEVFIKIPDVPNIFQPLVSVVPLQLVAYYVATDLGRDVDMPRNLAKSVTVE